MQIRTEFPDRAIHVAAGGGPRDAQTSPPSRARQSGGTPPADRACTSEPTARSRTLVRAQAAALVISPHAVVCDRTAAWVHGVDAFRYAELDVDPPLETYVLRGHRATNRPECNGGTRDLRPSDWTIIGGVRVTTPMRTALDLGCKLSRREAIAVMDALMREHGFTVVDLLRELRRYVRRRGVIQLRQLVPLVDGRAESSGESWTRIEIVDRGLPTPVPQHWVDVDGRPDVPP